MITINIHIDKVVIEQPKNEEQPIIIKECTSDNIENLINSIIKQF